MAETVAEVPELLAFWDTEENDVAPEDVMASSFRTRWWKCPRGHAFQRKPKLFAKDPVCPSCAIGGASLADTHPHLAKRWHPAKNAMAPSAVDAAHTAAVWWVCEDGHSFERSPLQMASDDGCPHCALRADSLAARFPEIAGEWSPPQR